MSVSNESTRQTGGVVPFVRAGHGQSHSEETKGLALVFYATGGARNCADVERMLARALEGTGEPVPTAQTIAGWAREENWPKKADELWRVSRGRMFYVNQIVAMGNVGTALEVIRDGMLGRLEGDVAEQAIKIKAAELALRAPERLPWLATIEPPAEAVDTPQMSRAEKDAYLRSQLVQRHRKGA